MCAEFRRHDGCPPDDGAGAGGQQRGPLKAEAVPDGVQPAFPPEELAERQLHFQKEMAGDAYEDDRYDASGTRLNLDAKSRKS